MIKLITPLTQIDSSPAFTLGTTTYTKEGNEYIYLRGVASVAQYDWVTFITAGSLSGESMSYGSVTRLATTGGKGLVGIAQAAITEGKSGWFQIKGIGWGNAGMKISAGGPLYSSGTAGQAGGSSTAGDLIVGAFSVGASASGGTAMVSLSYPFCTDTLT